MNELSETYIEDRDPVLSSVEALTIFKESTVHQDLVRFWEQRVVILRDELEKKLSIEEVRAIQGALQATRINLGLIDMLIEARKEQDNE